MKKTLIGLLSAVVAALLYIGTSGPAVADCNRDCNAECCQTIRITPWDKNRVCEPVCKSTCEAAKAACNATGGTVNLPHAPNIIREVEGALNQGCAAGFEVVTKAVIVSQGFYSAGSYAAINQAKALVARANILPPNLMNEVDIRWCRLSDAVGMAPDRNVICLNEDYIGTNDIVGLASTLAHELFHSQQYRDLGTDNFKCRYSRQYIACGGCQDRNHDLERAAYDFEAGVLPQLRRAASMSAPNLAPGPVPPMRPSASICSTPFGQCLMGVPIPQGSPCYCPTMQGPVWGQAF